jgi:hypothetical protein
MNNDVRPHCGSPHPESDGAAEEGEEYKQEVRSVQDGFTNHIQPAILPILKLTFSAFLWAVA